MPVIEITPEQQEHITNLVIKKLSDKASLSDSAIDRIRESIDLNPIIEAVVKLIPLPKNGIDGEQGDPGKDAEITEEIISSIVIKVVKELQEVFKQPSNGIDGRKGERGVQGLHGRDGQNGVQGAKGIQGEQGRQGIEGKQGDKGVKGETGSQGEIGPIGETGEQGNDAVVTDDIIQQIISSLDLSTHVTKKDLDKIIKKLLNDIALGQIELPQVQELGGGFTPNQMIKAFNRLIGNDEWQSPSIDISNNGVVIGRRDNENYSTDDNIEITSTDDALNDRINTVISIVDNPNFDSIDINDTVKTYLSGQIHFDPSQLTHIFDTAISGVRLNAGQEEYFMVYNNTASIIANGKACYASGVNVTNNILTVGLADNSSFLTSAQVLGLATHDIGINEIGLVTWRGRVNDFNTTATGFGLSYLGTLGNLTNIKPLYPANRIAMGALIKLGTTDGIFQVAIASIPRRSASRSYSFTSADAADAAAGVHYRAGFYEWNASSVTLNQGATSIAFGIAGLTRAAHAGAVPQAAGTVDTGQVGLQVTGTLDSESGVQVAAQTDIVTDDITTLTADTLAETLGKFSGSITYALYIVSGAPTTYSLTFNYGFSKYEDFRNIDGTVTAFSAVWEAGQSDTGFDVSLKFHNANGWTFAATGFVAGNGDICNRLTDQAIDSNITLGEDGAYKRTNLSQFIEGTAKEGIIIEVVTSGTKSIRSMDLHVSAFSEELF